MSNVNTLPSSGKRLSFFKLFSVMNFNVEIPIIQRDYAQGRESEHEVRETFLNALKKYLIEKNPNRDLDFVYGSITEDETSVKFVPLDGQQRLTTLFLLHWYLAQISNEAEVLRSVLYKNKKSLFRYETRSSSSEFCDALMGNNVDMSKLLKVVIDNVEKDSLSKTIQDTSWFHLSWTGDPTIQSMLNMFDSIHTKFSGHPEFFQRLIDLEHPVITFLFLDLKEFNLSDDLYIKMNARGKPLTDFENFKANFEQKIKTFRGDLENGYTLNFNGNSSVDGYDYFVHKVDTDWADLFWSYRNQLTNDETFDDKLMNFIRLIVANHCLLDKNASKTQSLKLESLFGDVGKLNTLSFFEYQDLNCLNSDFVSHFIELMDLLYGEGATGAGIQRYTSDEYYYLQDEVFRKVISNNTNYTEKIRFFAFYNYLAGGKDMAGLVDWMRVIFNLTENTIINNSTIYAGLLQTISELGENKESILELLQKNTSISGFNGAQVIEEKIKAHLLKKSDEWRNLIIKIERHPFFKGQIGFALNFAGILDLYRPDANWDWDEKLNKRYFDDFKSYAVKGCKVFDLIKDSSADCAYLWERAVLSKGIYFTDAGDDKWNMLSSRSTKNNVDRDHSWKRLLRIAVGRDAAGWERGQGFVKAVFDDPDFVFHDPDVVKASLKKICDKALVSLDVDDWRREFIKYEQLYSFSKQGFIYSKGKKILLLKESKRNHYYGELYSRVLCIELQKQPENLKPFNHIGYGDDLGEHGRPRAYLDRWIYKEKSHYINIQYTDSTYILDFVVFNFEICAEELGVIVEKHGFRSVEIDSKPFYRNECISAVEVEDRLKAICADFRELVHE